MGSRPPPRTNGCRPRTRRDSQTVPRCSSPRRAACRGVEDVEELFAKGGVRRDGSERAVGPNTRVAGSSGDAPRGNVQASVRDNQEALRAARAIASCRSQSACKRIQNWGDVFNRRARRNAVSAVMPLLPSTISFRRLSEIPSRRAAATWPIPIGLRNSSSSISPGGIAGPNQRESLVIIFDADFVGMALLPSERDAILIVDPNAVPTSVVPFQPLEPIAGRDGEILESCRDVDRLEFALRHPPERARNPSSGARVALAKQVNGRLIPERLNHGSTLYATRRVCNSTRESEAASHEHGHRTGSSRRRDSAASAG